MRALSSTEGPFLHYCEGPAISARSWHGGWSEPHPRWPTALPRAPLELAFLDLWVPQAVVARRVLGSEVVRGVQTEHIALTLRFDRAAWPKPPRDALAAGNNSRLARLAIRALPDPRPHGVMLAEVWIDQHGVLRRYSSTARRGNRSRRKARWVTTELWDFGGPPLVADRASQTVIDPITLKPVTTWRIRARRRCLSRQRHGSNAPGGPPRQQ